MTNLERYLAIAAAILTIIVAFATFFLVPSQYKTMGYITVIIFIELALIYVAYLFGEKGIKPEKPKAKNSDEVLLEFFEFKNNGHQNADIVRFGLALSTPVWLSHKYQTRKTIGELVEIAAKDPININATIKVLIDDLGWTNVELGLYKEAEEKIILGIELAEKNANNYYVAKGYRHLFGLNYRQSNFIVCEKHLEKSKELTDLLPSDRKKDELIAELHYATSSLEFKKGDFDKSMKEIEIAHTKYSLLGDREWIIKILARKGEILISQNQLEKAHQIFIQGVKDSETYHFNRQIVKNQMGLGLYHLKRNQILKAKTEYEKAKSIAVNIGMYYEKHIIDDQLEMIDATN